MIRCLNASTYTAENTKASKVHRGDIVLDVREVISEGLKAIDTLCAAWGRAREETVLAPETVPLSEAIPGFWRAMLTERQGELVGVLPGRIEHNVSDLTSAYYNERRNPGNVTRADLAQGWTKHIQGLDTPTRRDAEQAIGSWLVSNSEVGWVEARA